MARFRRSVLLSALLLAACSCSAVLLAAGQQQTVDGLTTTTDEASPPMPPSSSSSSTSMPPTTSSSTSTTTKPAAPAAAAAAPTPALATPSALAAPIDRAAFRTVATCSSLVQLPRPTSSSSSSTRNQTRPSVKSLNATLEMDVTPSYSSVWRGRDGNAGGWRPGRSRLNVSSLIKVSGGQDASAAASPLRVSARLHPLPCLPAGTALFGPLAYSASTAYRHNDQGTEADAPDGQPAEILGLKVMSKKKNVDGGGGNAVASSSSSSQVAGSATFPFLVDYDSAGSVVLYADDDDGATGSGVEDGGPPSSSSTSSSVPLACCNLSPPPPDFPEEWSAVIEANVRDKGYTMVVRQLYSASNKKVRLDVHSLGNDRVVVQDYKKGTATFIDGPNSTHPFGSCEVVKFDELAGGADAASQFGGGGGTGSGSGGESKAAKDSANAAADGSAPVAAGFSSSSSSKPKSQQQQQQKQDAFLPTAAALAFAPGGGAARAKFVPSAAFDVRGIPVETWARRVDEPATNSSYDLLYFFPVNAWLASGEDYHRLLKAIVVNGTQGGQRVYQEFHFVDFRPYGSGGSGSGGSAGSAAAAAAAANGTGIPPEAFDPCEIAPGGAGCGCGKKKKDAKAAPAAATDFAAFPAAAAGGGGVSSSLQQQQQQSAMGLLPSQVGSYVFFLFLGLVAGLLGAFGVPALVNCCCGRRGRSFGRFDEGNGAPPTSAVTSAA